MMAPPLHLSIPGAAHLSCRPDVESRTSCPRTTAQGTTMREFLVLYRSTVSVSTKEQVMRVIREQPRTSMDAWVGSPNRNPRLFRLSSMIRLNGFAA
jgi:hypothetical protein